MAKSKGLIYAGGDGSIAVRDIKSTGMKNKRKRKMRLIKEAAKRESDIRQRKREELENSMSAEWDSIREY